MIRASSILSRTLAATRAGSTVTRVGSAASFAVHNRFLQAAHYGSSTANDSHNLIVRLLCVAGATGIVGVTLYDLFGVQPPVHQLTDDIVLYYNATCTCACAEVKVFLDYHDIPYRVVEVFPLLDKKPINWSKDRQMPILIVDGEELNGLSAIMDRLGQKILSKQMADSTSEDDEETKWEDWVDEDLFCVLILNMFGTASEALKSTDYMMSNMKLRHKVAAKCIIMPVLYVMCKLDMLNHIYTDGHAALHEAAETLVNALNGREFLGGSKPNKGDMAVFGALRAIRSLTCGKELVEHTQIGEWYTRMENAVGKSSRIEV